jgi:hypothetical protein
MRLPKLSLSGPVPGEASHPTGKSSFASLEDDPNISITPVRQKTCGELPCADLAFICTLFFI